MSKSIEDLKPGDLLLEVRVDDDRELAVTVADYEMLEAVLAWLATGFGGRDPHVCKKWIQSMTTALCASIGCLVSGGDADAELAYTTATNLLRVARKAEAAFPLVKAAEADKNTVPDGGELL